MKKQKMKMNFSQLSRHRLFLYGFASLWIMFYHFCTRIPKIGILTPLYYIQETGACGVEMFLLLSGFGLYYSMKAEPSVSTFYRKRFLRVFLPSFITMAIYYILVDGSVIEYLGACTFAGYWFGMDVIWYIAFILTMYLLYPLIYRVLDRKVVMWGLLIGSLAVSFFAEHIEIEINILRGISRIPVFLIGCMIAPCVAEKQRIPGWVLPVFTAVSFMLSLHWYAKDWHRYYYFTRAALFFAYAVVLILVVCNVAEWIIKHNVLHGVYRWMAFCGTLSLELYLLYERVWISMESLPGFASDPFSFVKLDVAAIICTFILAVVLQHITGWLIDSFRKVQIPVAESER